MTEETRRGGYIDLIKGIIFVIMFTFVLVGTIVLIDDHAIYSTQIKNEENSDRAYAWYMQEHDINAYGPSCSGQAREWIDEYRAYHNLTREEYPCFVWYNDMEHYWSDY